jgi:alpha-ribazole phosphatase
VSGRLIHLLRHGETGTPGRLIGRTDVAVGAAGIAACVDQVAGLAFAAIVSSDLVRARACAEAIGAGVRLDPRWRELDFGAWDGLAPGAIDGEPLAAFWADPEASPPPAGERWSALVGRVAAALADLPPGDVLVVTHGGAMRAALAHLFGFDQARLWAFDLPCACLLSIRQWPDGAQIVGLAP